MVVHVGTLQTLPWIDVVKRLRYRRFQPTRNSMAVLSLALIEVPTEQASDGKNLPSAWKAWKPCNQRFPDSNDEDANRLIAYIEG